MYDRVFVASCLVVIASVLVCVAGIVAAIWAGSWLCVKIALTALIVLFPASWVMRFCEPK